MSDTLPGNQAQISVSAADGGAAPSSGYPVQLAKVTPPILRDDTLARPRLLDWLQAKIHSRLVLIIADAGYGKTTLLADFTRRTRRRVLWYRLDETDRGWAPFIAHLVAAGRRTEPGFAPATFELLGELGPTGPSRDDVVGTFLRELPDIAGSGIAIVLDDFHLVDDADEVVGLVRDLLARAPERVTLVLSSRRRPSIPIARLRTLGEVAELSGGDLRFDEAETDQLFREAYGCPLDRDTVVELTRRTDGWAASLHLVQAAIRGRTPREIRSFIRSLTATEGSLYDYLAEEVVGNLPPQLQRFVMRASLLESVEPDLAAVVAEIDIDEARRLITTAERFGLLGRKAPEAGSSRFHPLVKEFLSSRLTREIGFRETMRLHELLAIHAEMADWRTAAFHSIKAGDRARARDVVIRGLDTILARGQYEAAERLISELGSGVEPSAFAVIKSRASYRRGDLRMAFELAKQALDTDPSSEAAALNLLSLSFSARELAAASAFAADIADSTMTPGTRQMGWLYQLLLDASRAGDLRQAVDIFLSIAESSATERRAHYQGIALTNAAVMLRSIGDASTALKVATDGLDALGTSSSGPEQSSARMVRAWALAHLGDVLAAREEAHLALVEAGTVNHIECQLELADIEVWYGELEAATRALEVVSLSDDLDADQAEQLAVTEVAFAIRARQLDRAILASESIRFGDPSTAAGMESRRLTMRAHLALAVRRSDTEAQIQLAHDHASRQSATFWVKYASLLRGLAGDVSRLNGAIRAAIAADPVPITVLADEIADRMSDIDIDLRDELAKIALSRPDRWRDVARRLVHAGAPRHETTAWAGRLLDQIGSNIDIGPLRELSRKMGGHEHAGLGKRLAKRLARVVVIHDQGRVSLTIGAESVSGSRIRRKALALLCFLVTRPGFAAARDEVLEALWPEMNPATALNSLNQTIYFLRRSIEPDFADDTSPGYVHYQSDLVWLDTDLVDSDTARCKRILVELAKTPSPRYVDALTESYRGRFALDFAYEEWATDYRESLHAAYLATIEEAVRQDVQVGDFTRGVTLARRALEIDPEAHQIERVLVRIYRLSGAHAAASEQYSHYASALREDLGVEVPRLEDL